MPTSLIDTVFAASPAVRYVAVYRRGVLESRQRAGLAGASASESDKYEELIVNPTLLTLVKQRGDIDCGGMDHVLIRYGNFTEYVQPLADGHLSVGIEPDADAERVATAIRKLPDVKGALPK